MDNNQKINQIMQALQMREEGDWTNGMRTTTPTITGTARQTLVDELVALLTASE